MSWQCRAFWAGFLVFLEERVKVIACLLQCAGFLVAPMASLLHNQNSELYVPATILAAWLCLFDAVCSARHAIPSRIAARPK